MKKMKLYEPDDQMLSLIRDNYNVLQNLSAFGIGMGFGTKTVREVCEAHGVDTFTFLAVVNLTINGYHSQNDIHHLDVRTLLQYLRASHRYYIDFLLPFLRKELVEALIEGDRLGNLIIKMFDEYARFITHHMRYEEQTLFPYVEELLGGERKAGYDIELTRTIAENVGIPVIASGGAGKVEHFKDALTVGKADAALAASLFHYKELEIRQVKDYLADRGIPVRR